MKIRLEFNPRDLWVGIYWKSQPGQHDMWCWKCGQIDLWVCLLPTLPLHLTWIRHSQDCVHSNWI